MKIPLTKVFDIFGKRHGNNWYKVKVCIFKEMCTKYMEHTDIKHKHTQMSET